MGHSANANGSDPHSVPHCGRVTLALAPNDNDEAPVSDAGASLFRVGDPLDREPVLERHRAPNQYRYQRYDVEPAIKPPRREAPPKRAMGFVR